MDTSAYPFLIVEITDSIATITLNRAKVHNAFNGEMIDSLTRVFQDISKEPQLRAIILQGAGPSFSAGGDLNWMRASLEWTYEQNLADTTALAAMFAAINDCPVPVVGKIHGAAMGGGTGLVAVCDIAIATDLTRFAFSEAKLGLVPATIAPFVIAKIGQTHARALFMTAERFNAARALQIGLVHLVVPVDQLDDAVTTAINQLRTSGPIASRTAKQLVKMLTTVTSSTLTQQTIELIAHLRVSPEGQEGLRAFLEKRRASWAEEI